MLGQQTFISDPELLLMYLVESQEGDDEVWGPGERYSRKEEEFYSFWTKFIFKLQSTICLCKIGSSMDERWPHMRDSLCLVNPLGDLMSQKSGRDYEAIARSIARVVAHLFVLAVFIGYTYGLLLELDKSSLLLHWDPETNNLRSNCNASDPLTFAHQSDRLRFERIINTTIKVKRGVSFIPLSTQTDMLCVSIFACSIVGYFYLGIIISAKRVRVDFISFLCNPRIDRSIVKEEVNNIFDSLEKSIQHTNCSLRFESIENCQFYHSDEFAKIKLNSPPIVTSFLMGKLIKIRYKNTFVYLIRRTQRMDLIKPHVMSSSYHRSASRRYISYFLATTSFAASSAVLISIMYIMEELMKRVDTRLYFYNCHSSISVTKFMYINLLEELTPQDEDKFRSYTTSGASYFELFLLESKYYLSDAQVILKTTFSTILGFFLHIAYFFFGGIFLCSHKNKSDWLAELREQLSKCIRLMTSLNESSTTLRSKAVHEGEINFNLYRTLTVTYINFELFRKRHRNFQRLASLLILQVAIACTPTFYILFLSVKSMESKFIFTAAIFYVFFFSNIYLIMSAILTSRIFKMRELVLRLIGTSKLNNFSHCHILENFFRSIESPEATSKLYAPNLAGVTLNFTNVLVINGYIILVFCMLTM